MKELCTACTFDIESSPRTFPGRPTSVVPHLFVAEVLRAVDRKFRGNYFLRAKDLGSAVFGYSWVVGTCRIELQAELLRSYLRVPFFLA